MFHASNIYKQIFMYPDYPAISNLTKINKYIMEKYSLLLYASINTIFFFLSLSLFPSYLVPQLLLK